MPQKRDDTSGNFVIFEPNDECQPRAVPCQVGPDLRKMSSGGRNVSIEDVRKS